MNTCQLRFINMLSTEFTRIGCQTFHAQGDADYLIVQKALASSSSNKTAIIGDDTDLLVLLLHHLPNQAHDLYFLPEPKKGSKHPKLWNIQDLKSTLPAEISANILFLHAFLGCDTTSRIFGVGKGALLKKIQTSSILKEAAKTFNNLNSDSSMISTAGETVFKVIYGAKQNETLGSLRYRKYCEKVALGSSQVESYSLPPTAAAAKFHSFRVFFQMCMWNNESIDINAENWGWIRENAELIPIQTDLPPAPEELLKIIRCNCQADCSSQRCSCRKHNMKCSLACGHCKGGGCMNATLIEASDAEAYDD